MTNMNDELPNTGKPLPSTREWTLGDGMLVAQESRPEKPLVGAPPPAPEASNDPNPVAASEPHSADCPVEVSQAKTCTKPRETSVSDIQGSGATQQESFEEKVSSATEAGTDVASDTSSKISRSSYKRKKPKKDRSKLRKGKWTPEEEEYTSRIIHYFSSGILTLPEGTTIRGYLADKLNCDPMRITKKYAGAACLGKRVYHFVDRPPATVNQVEMAKADLAQLEQRFRLRVEHGQTGTSIPPRNDLFPDANNNGMFAPAQMSGFLQNLSGTATPGAFASAPAAATVAQTPVGAPAAFPGALLPFFNPSAFMPGVVPAMPMLPASGQNPLAALAWAQAAASLSPAISQLAVANLQQQQLDLQKAFEARLQEIAKETVGNTATVAPTSPPAAAQKIQEKIQATPTHAPASVHTMQPPGTAQVGVAQAPFSPAKPTHAQPTAQSPRSKEDEDAGSMLMGFLSSLRKGYEEALSEREQSEGKVSATLSGHKHQRGIPPRAISAERAETESGTTSYPAESSLEDSDEAGKSNKQTSSSSEGDSDKDSSERESSGERGSSSEEGGSVPPRKRMKGKHPVNEFTRQNVAEHNHRMDVMRLGSTQQDPSKLGSHWPRGGRPNDD